MFGDSDYSFALGANARGDYVGQGSYFAGEDNAHVFLTSASSTGPLRTLMPLSGDPADFSSAHAVTSGKVAVGGESETDRGEVRATVWTCAYKQAFVPDTDILESSTPGSAVTGPTAARGGLLDLWSQWTDR